mmetsp:Transcript_51117/g.165470  ORF Transcript_51117/g.165470 Transcript_51117/m.165470 type:complete len:205 (+) Transcript_51117:341-955(+)
MVRNGKAFAVQHHIAATRALPAGLAGGLEDSDHVFDEILHGEHRMIAARVPKAAVDDGVPLVATREHAEVGLPPGYASPREDVLVLVPPKQGLCKGVGGHCNVVLANLEEAHHTLSRAPLAVPLRHPPLWHLLLEQAHGREDPVVLEILGPILVCGTLLKREGFDLLRACRSTVVLAADLQQRRHGHVPLLHQRAPGSVALMGE